MSVFRYIDAFCNSVRNHQTLEGKSPKRFEAEHTTSLAV